MAMSDSPTGRRPTFPNFQDPNWGRTSGRFHRVGQPPRRTIVVDYAGVENRLLEHMVYQTLAAKRAMAAILENLPPGAKVYMDTVDLSEVAPEDLRKYEERMRRWVADHDPRRKRCATDETPLTSSETPEEPGPATGAPAEPTSGD